ncbi:unnamed protein product, partial [Oppiella nova]
MYDRTHTTITYNFGIQSCEPCKAFFRRNAFRENDQTFSCYFDNKCEIDVITRRFCRKCRLIKCFAVGMNKAYMFSGEQRRKRKAIVEENRRKSKVNNELNAIHSSDTSSQTQSDSSLNDTNNVSMIVENDVNTDSANNSQNILDLNDIEIEESFAEHFPMIPIPNQINTYDKNLNHIEMNRLEELLTATKQIWEPISEITSESVDYPDVRYTMHTKWERDVSRLTLLSKHLSSFTGICDEDRMFLLKAGYREILHMRSLVVYNNDRQHWAIVLDLNNTTVLKVTTLKMFGQDFYELYKNFFNKYGREWDFDSIILDLLTVIALYTPDRPNIMHKHAVKLQQQIIEINQNVYEINKNFFTKFGGEWDFDSIIVDLLTAVALFTPDQPNIIHKNMVKLQQQMYIHLLRRYLRLKYSDTEMNAKFATLMKCLSE